jgi:hypothetical protein
MDYRPSPDPADVLLARHFLTLLLRLRSPRHLTCSTSNGNFFQPSAFGPVALSQVYPPVPIPVPIPVPCSAALCCALPSCSSSIDNLSIASREDCYLPATTTLPHSQLTLHEYHQSSLSLFSSSAASPISIIISPKQIRAKDNITKPSTYRLNHHDREIRKKKVNLPLPLTFFFL